MKISSTLSYQMMRAELVQQSLAKSLQHMEQVRQCEAKKVQPVHQVPSEAERLRLEAMALKNEPGRLDVYLDPNSVNIFV